MGPCWRLSAPGQRYETVHCSGNRWRPDALSRAHAGVGLKHLDLSGDLALGIVRAFDASPNPYVLLTPDLRFAGMNQAYLDVVGRAREELVDRPIFDIFDGGGSSEKAVENARQLRESLERVFTSGQRDHLALIHYPIGMIGADGVVRIEDRWWSATNTPVRNAAGEVVYVLQHTTDVTELELLRRRVTSDADRSAVNAILSGNVMARAEHVQKDNRRLHAERNRLMDLFIQAPGFVAVLTGPDHVFQMHNTACGQMVGGRPILGLPLAQAVPELAGQGFISLLDEVRTTGEAYEGHRVPVQLVHTSGGKLETVYVDFVFQPLCDEDEVVAGVFVQGHDVTDAVRADERQRLMIDELNHRVKNTLATVQSIAMQTARYNPDPVRFAESFQARLMALSHTHDLLTRSHWEGAALFDVLRHETEAHGRRRVALHGPPVELKPASALALGMIFHELATNAAKYGALSVSDGRVAVTWTLDEGSLSLVWRETGGPSASRPERRGFGSRLIERSVRHDLAGEIETDYGQSGLVASLTIPAESGRA